MSLILFIQKVRFYVFAKFIDYFIWNKNFANFSTIQYQKDINNSQFCIFAIYNLKVIDSILLKMKLNIIHFVMLFCNTKLILKTLESW